MIFSEKNGASKRMVEDVERGNVEGFMTCLQTFFEDNDYRITGKMEIYFQNVLYTLFKLMGFYVEMERATARGRMDIV